MTTVGPFYLPHLIKYLINPCLKYLTLWMTKGFISSKIKQNQLQMVESHSVGIRTCTTKPPKHQWSPQLPRMKKTMSCWAVGSSNPAHLGWKVFHERLSSLGMSSPCSSTHCWKHHISNIPASSTTQPSSRNRYCDKRPSPTHKAKSTYHYHYIPLWA